MPMEPQTNHSGRMGRFLTLPENADCRFELIDGEIIEKMPTQPDLAA